MTSVTPAITNNLSWLDKFKLAGNTYMNFSFGCGQDSKFVESIFGRGESKTKMGARDAWAHAGLGNSWWQSCKDAFNRKLMKEEWEGLKITPEGAKPAGVLKRSGKFFLKRMPFIGNALALVMEVPNVYRAFTDKEHGGGLGAGIVETAKAAVKFTAFAAGAALGALVPGIGFITAFAGGIAAGWVADKILGKSFTDKKEEAEAAQQAQMAQAQPPQAAGNQQTLPQGTVNPFSPTGLPQNSLFDTGWMDQDFMTLGSKFPQPMVAGSK